MPTGKVELLGTAISSPPYSGTLTASAFDNDFATHFAAADQTLGWVGRDFGQNNVQVTDISISARQEIWPDTNQTGLGAQNWEIRAGNTLPAGDGTNNPQIDLFSNAPHKNRWIFDTQRNYEVLNTAAIGRYCILKTDWFSNVAELMFGGPPPAGGVLCRPWLPTISGKRFTFGSTLITLASRTTSAALYYTTDGSTPTTASTSYTAPFEFTPAPGGTTIKVLADDPTCSTRSSLITSATFFQRTSPNLWTQRMDLRDDREILVDAHEGRMTTFPAFPNTYFLFGPSYNRSTSGAQIVAGSTVNIYTGDDLVNWTYIDAICSLKTFGLNLHSAVFLNRWHVIGPNPTSGKYVAWGSGGDSTFPNAQRVLTADDPRGPWTYIGTANSGGHGFADCNLFQDDDGSAYIVRNPFLGGDLDPNAGQLVITKLNATWTDTTASEVIFAMGTWREGLALFKRNGVYFLCHGAPSFYGENPDWDLRYNVSQAANPLSGWNAGIGAPMHTVNPQGTSANGQITSVFKLLGPGDRWAVLKDHYTGDALATDMRGSRYVLCPVTFPTDTTLVVDNIDGWNTSTPPTTVNNALYTIRPSQGHRASGRQPLPQYRR